MLRYIVWGLGVALVLVACKTDSTKSSIQAGTLITQSTQFDQDTIFWDLTNDQAGLIIDTEEDLTLDFQGAVLAGKTFGQQPDRHQGTAIEAIKAGKLHIKNADFRAFQQGIAAEQIEHLVLEDCSFSHFYGAPIDQPLKLESFGLNLLKVDTLTISNVRFRHLDRALELAFVDRIRIDQSAFAWLRAGVIRVDQAKELEILSSHFVYVGLPEKRSLIFDLPELTIDFRRNYGAYLNLMDLEDFDSLSRENELAYVTSFPEQQWNTSTIDSLLLTYGVTTPDLILLDPWGVYDHTYPKVWFRQTQNESDVFLLTAPPGNWRLVGGTGYDRVIPKTGTFPTTLRAEKTAEADSFALEFEYLGKSVQRFGKPYRSLKTFTFEGNVSEK